MALTTKIISTWGAKPEIPAVFCNRWQRMVNLMREVTDTPAALITRVSIQQIEMLISSQNDTNPYPASSQYPRHCGLYCDQVISSQQSLLVQNARESEQWCKNPDLEHDLSFYLGYPLSWPDGEPFGTLCVLDIRDNPEAVRYRDLMESFAQLVAEDLALLWDMVQQQTDHSAAQLASRSDELEELRIAMKVLLQHKESDKKTMTEQVRGELLLLIAPYLDQLERSDLNLDQQQVIQGLRQQLNDNVQWSELLMLANLTPAEREVAKGIQKNLPSKLIADNLNIEKSTVDFHRRNIRQKLNLVHSRTSLKHYFQNLSVDI